MLIWFAVPGVFAGHYMTSHRDTIRELRTGEPVTAGALYDAILARREALDWTDSPAVWAEIGELRLILAALYPEEAAETDVVSDSISASRSAVEGSPTMPFAWLRMAEAMALRDGAEADINAQLMMAIVTAPQHAGMVRRRVELALFYWAQLDDRARQYSAGQVRIAAQQDPSALAEIVKRQNALREVMAILLTDNELLQEFTQVYYREQGIEQERAAEEEAAEAAADDDGETADQ